MGKDDGNGTRRGLVRCWVWLEDASASFAGRFHRGKVGETGGKKENAGDDDGHASPEGDT